MTAAAAVSEEAAAWDQLLSVLLPVTEAAVRNREDPAAVLNPVHSESPLAPLPALLLWVGPP